MTLLRNAMLLCICAQTFVQTQAFAQPSSSILKKGKVITQETTLYPAGTEFVYGCRLGTSSDTQACLVRVNGKIELHTSTGHQQFRRVLSENQLPSGAKLANRTENPVDGDSNAPIGGLWVAEENGQPVVYFTTITSTTAGFAQASYRLPLSSANPVPQRIVGIGDTITLVFAEGPITGKVTKSPLVYRNRLGNKERVFLEILPTGSAKAVQAIVELGDNASLRVISDMRDHNFDAFNLQVQETKDSERRLLTDSLDVTYVADENPPNIFGINQSAGTRFWLFSGYALSKLDQLFGAGTKRWFFANYFIVPKDTMRQQETVVMESQTSDTENPNLFFFYDRVIEIAPYQGQQAEIRFDRATFQPHLATIGKIATNTNFSLMAVQVEKEGGIYATDASMPNAFLVSTVPEFQEGQYTAFPKGAWNWDILVSRGDTLPGGEKVDTLSPAFSASGPCSVSFSTLSGGFNGKFAKAYGVSTPCVTSASSVPSGNSFDLLGDNLSVDGLTTTVFFNGGDFKLDCPAASRTKITCTMLAGLQAGDYLLYVSLTDGKGNESRSRIFVVTVTPPPPPTISSVVNGADFKVEPLSPGAWFTIFGQNFGQAGQWTGPNTFSVGGAGVTVCGIPAQVSYNSGPVSKPQLNALMPDGVMGQSSCPVVVIAGRQSSQPVNVAVAGGMMELFNFTSSAGTLPIITHQNYTLVGPGSAGLQPAMVDEVVIAWGTGDCSKPTMTVGGSVAEVKFAGRVGPGLCQFNFVVPRNLSGDILTISTSPNQYHLTVAP